MWCVDADVEVGWPRLSTSTDVVITVVSLSLVLIVVAEFGKM